MKYEILYPDAFPIIRCNLEQGEGIKAESGAMVSASPTIDIGAGVDGGIMKGLGRMLSGEKFFFQYLKADRGPGEVTLAQSQPGSIIPLELNNETYFVQKDGFLASTNSINVETKMQNLAKGLFSGEGFFIVKISGTGLLFLSSFGAVHEINLNAGEEYIIDNGHLVAWESSLNYKIEKASSGWGASIFSGECLVCRFTGPGKIFIQTRNPSAFAGWLRGLGLGGGK